ncbi:MAG: hypothetical protein K8U03_05385 [Planctomycetia bacterium]|nr:hypothetical protein [Planctomycetia bacterium]
MTPLARLSFVAGFCFALCAALAQAEERPKYRIDADGPVGPNQPKKVHPKDQTALEWYQVVEGRFPPAGSAHAITGELIFVDHLERRFHLRVDRNDSQDRGVWDLPVDAAMLPYGAIYYHGAPAALQDIPLGTHLHGQFYMRAPDDKTASPSANYNRKTPEVDFRRCFLLEDDFSHHAKQNELWKIESVDLSTKKLVAVLQRNGAPAEKPRTFDLLTSTRVLHGNGFGNLESIKPGQSALFNLTWGTLYGPGRIVDIMLDEPSRRLATAQQLERHRNHTRERGLAGWIDEVDDEKQIVTITFFGGVDPKLFDELTHINPEPFGWPLSKPEDKPLEPKGTIAVARESLMTYDPVNDRKGGNILDIRKVPIEPGSGGVRIRVKCDMLLEGYRPHRIVRFYPATWKVIALPQEEQFQGRE